MNDKKLYQITRVDYQDSNADRLENNADFVESQGIDNALQEVRDQGFAATKADFVSHSMGGLLIRQYCADHAQECSGKIRKIITIDTPHRGSELANLISDVNQAQGTKCYTVLSKIDRPGRRIWQDTQRTILQGALVDLAVGSPALQNLAGSSMTVPITAMSGAAHPGTSWAYDNGLEAMWFGLWFYCNRVPDAAYTGSHPETLLPVFSGVNDRIVSVDSQLGFGSDQLTILNVDHITVLQNQETTTRVKQILENP